jgi:hypothetical protein
VNQQKCLYGTIGLGVLVVNALQLVHGSSGSTTTGEFGNYSEDPTGQEPALKSTCLRGTGCMPSPGGQPTVTSTVVRDRGAVKSVRDGALEKEKTEEVTHALTHTRAVPVVRLT